MRIKLDENLPERLLGRLAALGHEVDNVRMEGLAGAADPQVWDAAQAEGRFLITQDLDFSDIRKFPPGTHAGVLLVRLPNAGRLELAGRVGALFEDHPDADWSGHYLILSQHRVRIVAPSGS